MSTAIVVTRSPYFAVTDQYGRFVIERLPAVSTKWKLGTNDWGAKINGFNFVTVETMIPFNGVIVGRLIVRFGADATREGAPESQRQLM